MNEKVYHFCKMAITMVSVVCSMVAEWLSLQKFRTDMQHETI